MLAKQLSSVGFEVKLIDQSRGLSFLSSKLHNLILFYNKPKVYFDDNFLKDFKDILKDFVKTKFEYIKISLFSEVPCVELF